MKSSSFLLIWLLVAFTQLASAVIPTPNHFPLANELDKVNQKFDLNSMTRKWMDNCEARNGSDATESIEDSFQSLVNCILNKFNIANISDEIKLATPKGTLDEVFAHYCNLVPELKKCRDPLTESLEVCLDAQGAQDLHSLNAAMDGALDFMCYKGGERIAIFLAENGTECLASHSEKLFRCMNDTLPDVESIFETIESSNASIFHVNHCRVESKFKTCVVDTLKTCSDPTPANVIEGLMNSMQKATPCYVHNSASASSLSSWMWLTITFTFSRLIRSLFF